MDEDNDPSDLVMSWYIGATTVCEQTPLDQNGMQECTATLTDGMASIVSEVRDPSDAAGRFELAFTIETNQEPIAAIVGPSASSVFYANESILLEGVVSDPEDISTDLQVEWRSNLDGVLDTTPAAEDGTTSVEVLLTEGSHQLELYVEDTEGLSNADLISIQVREPNQAPTCDFVSPQDADIVEVGEVIQFQAVVSDPNISSDQIMVQWSSDKDGVFGTATAGTDGVSNLLYDALSINTHVTCRLKTSRD